MANRSDREQGQPKRCLRRHSLISRMGPRSRTPSGPAVSTDCIKQAGQKTAPDQCHYVNLALAMREPSTEDMVGLAANVSFRPKADSECTAFRGDVHLRNPGGRPVREWRSHRARRQLSGVPQRASAALSPDRAGCVDSGADTMPLMAAT